MFKLYAFIFALFLMACPLVTAQEVTDSGNLIKEPISKKAEKIDEFGRLGDCDLSSRTDNFFVSLQKKPNHEGYLIVYNGIKVLPAEYDQYPIERLIVNQINFRNFDRSRITIVRGGFRAEPHAELWIVPPGAERPEPSDTLPEPSIPENKTLLFDSTMMISEFSDDPLAEFILPSVKAREEAEQSEMSRDAEMEENHEPETGEPEGENHELESGEPEEENKIETEIEIADTRTPEEIESEKFRWVSAKFGELLKSRKQESGVIILRR